MSTFDSAFFNELAKLDAVVKLSEYEFALMPPRDGFRLHLSELRDAGKISEDFVRVTHEFVSALSKRSRGRYEFEMDFIVHPYVVESRSQGRAGRKQLQVCFDAYPLGGMFHRDWGVSIGMNFDFRNEHGIITECVNEYEAFEMKLHSDPELFDATFGSLGGYDGSTESIKEPVNAGKVCQSPVHITQRSLFFGKRLTPDAILAFGSLDGFVNECIRVFDLICDAGYYHADRKVPILNLCVGGDCFMDISKLVSDAVVHIRIKKEDPEAIIGISTCFPSLDNFTSGLQRGTLIVVAGRPSMGKGIFVHNIAVHVALVNKLPVAILENETGGVALTIRMLASIAKIGWHDLRTGEISDDESERFESAADTLKKAPIYFSSLTPLSVQELGNQLRQLSQRSGELGLIVVDCLPELKLSGEKMNNDYAIIIAHTSRYLKTLATELNAPLVVLSPVERDLEERSNKRPFLTDLPGKGAIANAADLVLMVYRDEVYDTESEESGTAQIIISRNHEGAIGGCSLKFDGRSGTFEEINYER